MTDPIPFTSLILSSPDETAALAEHLAPLLVAGDVVLLDGPIGAGKSHFCRSLIQARLAAENMHEDVPSPTFTLVQVYDLADVSIWHADLYRLSSPQQAEELGLEEAFAEAITLIEWPDRLDKLMPKSALTLHISPVFDSDVREVEFFASAPRWQQFLSGLSANWSGKHD
ncbi:MAG: tRNA (adenosine(37)-N6)-threonylcarbamoyltransferase complex ATPase subunit type 1 TsaE [Albidovulum sp.]